MDREKQDQFGNEHPKGEPNNFLETLEQSKEDLIGLCYLTVMACEESQEEEPLRQSCLDFKKVAIGGAQV
ncbi:hypothetical protein Tco_0552107 [Tanacetum coccineum]